MKKGHFLIPALVAGAALAFSANAAFAGSMTFNPSTGVATYKTGDVAHDDYGHPAGKDDHVQIGSSHPDSVTGSADANVFKGGGGNDSLFGLGGDDSLDGQVGTDTLDGGLNTDKCVGETLSNCEK